MNRRTFLKTTAATLAAGAAPQGCKPAAGQAAARGTELSFTREYDVIVAGAGVAGVAAALEVARAGLGVALVEKTVMSGGLATAGFVNDYLPLCDGRGTQVSFGITEEFFHASALHGPGAPPPDWKTPVNGKTRRLHLRFSPAAFALTLDELMDRERAIDRWYDTLVCASVVENGRVAGIEVENKSGRGRLLAKCVIDATGDGDVAARAGCAFHEETNKLTIWALQCSLAAARRAAKANNAAPLLNLHLLGLEGGRLTPEEKLRQRPWRGTDGKSVSRYVIETHRALLRHYIEREGTGVRENSPKNLWPFALPAMAQFRTTRAVNGRATLDSDMDWRRFEDSIGLVADWRERGKVWEIPFGTLVPESVGGLLTAGRCISSRNDAWEVTRVIPPAAQTGQVAGIAATLAVRRGILPAAVPAADVQAELRKKGIPYHFADAGLSAPDGQG
ncbi:MAG: FAD-dependent oxidoreductase [Opitutaceae bacterium]|jgi:hypothetical protein|nr:FAD-dependent oxidoreductase [Opitutaceae bacterium]